MVVIDDIFALRTMQLAEMYGYSIPDDLSVVSFNNSIFSTLMHPYLTSIDIDISELGRMAMQKLREIIYDELSSGVRMVIPHKLIKSIQDWRYSLAKVFNLIHRKLFNLV